MPKRKIKNPLVISVVAFLTILLIGFLVANFTADSMVSDFLKRKLPDHIQLDYEKMEVNVLTGTIELKDIELRLYDRDTTLLHTEAKMEAIALKGLGYWQFFVNKSIDLDELYLQRPEVRHYLHQELPKKATEPQGVVRLLKTIEIEVLRVDDGRLELFQENGDSIAFQAKNIHFNLMNAKTDPELIKEKIPITYSGYDFSTEDLFVDLGPYEQLRVGAVVLEKNNVKVKNLALNSKFSKTALSKQITTERDHIDLKISETTLEAVEVGFKSDTLFVTTGPGKIINPIAEIFRDKLVPDDMSKKRMYSQMLRELPFHINIPKIEITDGRLVYSEKVATILAPGKISFDDMNARLLNISNDSRSNDQTTISAEANLMDHSPIELDWTFDVSKKNDAFTASGIISDFKSKSINDFLQSNLRAKAKGTINRMYFTVSGNAISSSGEMKMKYQDFEFSVLKKNRLGVNKLLTAIGNIIINDGSNADEDGFRYGEIEVERDPTKSFFNYLWLNVRDGTVNTLVGKGEKKSKNN